MIAIKEKNIQLKSSYPMFMDGELLLLAAQFLHGRIRKN